MTESRLLLQIYDVPEHITQSELSVTHDTVASWELLNVVPVESSYVANVLLCLSSPVELVDLEGELSVSSSIHTIDGVDLALSVYCHVLFNQGAMRPFSVVGFYEESGQVVFDHVSSSSHSQAMFQTAQRRPDATIILALDGWHNEGESVFFAGESVVESETILSQPDVFNC